MSIYLSEDARFEVSSSLSPAMTPKPSLNAMEREVESPSTMPPPTYKVYKRRFWGLAQLVLLNVVVSWDVRALENLR